MSDPEQHVCMMSISAPTAAVYFPFFEKSFNSSFKLALQYIPNVTDTFSFSVTLFSFFIVQLAAYQIIINTCVFDISLNS